MKRFFTILASSALLATVAFSNSASAAWGNNFGVPVGPAVGQSSTPIFNKASGPVTTPFNPNANLGNVPGSAKDRFVQGALERQKASKSGFGYNPNNPIFVPNQAPVQPRPSRPSRERPTAPVGTYGGTTQPGTGYFGHDVLSRPRPPVATSPYQYPPMQPQYPQYPQAQRPSSYPPVQPHYPQYPQAQTPIKYPPVQPASTYPTSGYGQTSGTYGGGWGTANTGSSWGGYGSR